jgi:hypothetical protein
MDSKINMTKGIEEKAEKITAIRAHFLPLIGKALIEFETAQLLLDNDEWDNWFDLPIRLLFHPDMKVSVGWSHFDNLFLSHDDSVNFSIEDALVRWKRNGIAPMCQAIGEPLQSVALGRGDMSVEGNDIEIWSSIVLEFQTGWLEIYNGMDENAFVFHIQKTAGVFLHVC